MPPSLDPQLAQRIVASATSFAIIAMTEAGEVISWNPGAEHVLGWPAAEAIGANIGMIFTAEDKAAGLPDDEINRATRDGRAIDERFHLRRDGSRFWASGLLMPLAEAPGEGRRFVKIMWDRTAERDADRRYHALTAALPGFVFVTDADGNNTETNLFFRSYTGLGEAELNGDGWLDAVHPDDREQARHYWERSIGSGNLYSTRIRFRRHDGSYRCFDCRGAPEREDDGRVVRWMGTCIDVEDQTRARAALERLNLSLEHRATEREADLATAIEQLQVEIAERARTEDALRQSQKVEAMGQLTGGVAHDFNNLLTIIRSSVDLLRRPNLPDDKRRRYLEAISDTADRAAALTRQLLAFGRRQPLQPETIDLCARLQQLVPMLQTTLGSRITLALKCDTDAALVETDPNQFETAMLNLVVNARDAMAGEGHIAISLRRVGELPARRAHAAAPGDYISVAVSDTGQGIALAEQQRIFEPFYTTKEVGRGTGLGLSQVYGFARQSGGDVIVASTTGEGATFTLYLPYAVAAPPAVAVALPESPVERPQHRCVLVVEDNQLVGEFAAQLMEELGYGTMWAGSAQAALDLLADHPGRFDAVFSDVVMPGMNGVEFARRVRDNYPGMSVILTSGYSEVLAQEGTHGFPLLHKPYSVESLSRALRNAKPS